MRGTTRWTAAAGAAIVLAAGCAQGEPAAVPDPLPAGTAEPAAAEVPVTLTLAQSRAFASRRMLQVRLRNDGDQPVRIERFDLRTGRFAPAGPVARDTEIAPGRRLFVPLPYGEARCDAPAGDAVLTVRARVGDGPPGDADLALPAPDPLLERLHGRECAQATLRAQVDIAFAPAWTTDGDVVRGTLVVSRRGSGGEQVTVAGIQGNVLYTLRAVPPPPAVLAPDAARLELPVEVTLARCEAHALIEAKLRHQFPLWAGAGDRPADYLTVEAGDEGRRRLDDLLDRCLARG